MTKKDVDIENSVSCAPVSLSGEVELRSEEFQEVLGVVPHWILRWGIAILAVFVVVLLVGSALFKYPDVISAPVTLTGTIPPAEIVARSSGKLKELFVSDNQNVKTGEYLAVIDNPARTEDVLTLKRFLTGFDREDDKDLSLPDKHLQLGNLQSLYSQFYTALFEYLEYKRLAYFQQKIIMTQERIMQYEWQYQNLLRQQTIGREQFILAQKQFQRDSLLHGKGHISQEEYEQSQNTYLQAWMSRENMQSSVDNMQIQIAQLRESLLDTQQQNVEKSNSLHTQLQSLVSQLTAEIESWELTYVLQSPVGGKITFTNYWIENQNIPAGGEIFSIVPEADSEIIGKAQLPVARSGKVKVGQKVNIRLDNFPDQEYGILRGIVKNISLVPMQDGTTASYTVEIALPEKLTTTYRKELPSLPNMQGQADIITDDISLLQRLILPIRKLLTENS
ncbi:MAG: HlyD family secretion protein [Dysgonamonadaceae bacterium]|jgi:HlyD family secretion protein|nr:HlyD family secretion protein [Dysgonamonadaceae bacterium]